MASRVRFFPVAIELVHNGRRLIVRLIAIIHLGRSLRRTISAEEWDARHEWRARRKFELPARPRRPFILRGIFVFSFWLKNTKIPRAKQAYYNKYRPDASFQFLVFFSVKTCSSLSGERRVLFQLAFIGCFRIFPHYSEVFFKKYLPTPPK